MGEKKQDGGTFGRRYEKKFVVDEKIIRDFAVKPDSDFAKKFIFDNNRDDSIYTIIENIYFDSHDLHSYNDSMEKKKERHKMRVRYYAQDGLPESNLFLEIKSSVEKETIKNRVKLKKSWLRRLLAYEEIPMEKILKINANKTPEEIKQFIQQVDYFTKDLGYKPMLKSSYMRFAFKLKETDKVRITMDRDLKFTRLNFSVDPEIPYEKSILDNEVIVEVKIGDPKYSDLVKFFKEHFGSSRGFSKYCYGINHTKHRFLAKDRELSRTALKNYQP
jgi:SPX domain protein involved in polyphosphate accumulation